MSINIQIKHNDEIVGLLDAINRGYVKIIGSRIESKNNTTLSLSTNLFDYNGNELFENDIVQDDNGKYLIIYDFGLFYLQEVINKTRVPLFIYKLGNKVNVVKVTF